jgi:hypothetical protein
MTGYITMKGEFVYYADAAVLQTKNDIYGVVIDKNMHALADQVKPFQNGRHGYGAGNGKRYANLKSLRMKRAGHIA